MNRLATVFLSSVIAIAVIGFLVGIGDGVPKPDGVSASPLSGIDPSEPAATHTKLIPAIGYAEIASTPMGPTKSWQAEPQSLPPVELDMYAKKKLSDEEKEALYEVRASRRAYSGAPPMIPHPVENTNDAACYACHSGGVQIGDLKASVMSHGFLANCVQCHASPPPAPFQSADGSVESDFVGLAAPKEGTRSYPGAPPTIPHSTWMRDNCNACHGWSGMEEKHPFRTNCVQCHASSATLEQAFAESTSQRRTRWTRDSRGREANER